MTTWGHFIRAVFNREHKLAPWTVVSVIGAILYTISPVDLIPDPLIALFGLGIVDDLGFWGLVAMLLGREKGRWEATLKASAIEVESP